MENIAEHDSLTSGSYCHNYAGQDAESIDWLPEAPVEPVVARVDWLPAPVAAPEVPEVPEPLPQQESFDAQMIADIEAELTPSEWPINRADNIFAHAKLLVCRVNRSLTLPTMTMREHLQHAQGLAADAVATPMSALQDKGSAAYAYMLPSCHIKACQPAWSVANTHFDYTVENSAKRVAAHQLAQAIYKGGSIKGVFSAPSTWVTTEVNHFNVKAHLADGTLTPAQVDSIRIAHSGQFSRLLADYNGVPFRNSTYQSYAYEVKPQIDAETGLFLLDAPAKLELLDRETVEAANQRQQALYAAFINRRASASADKRRKIVATTANAKRNRAGASKRKRSSAPKSSSTTSTSWSDRDEDASLDAEPYDPKRLISVNENPPKRSRTAVPRRRSARPQGSDLISTAMPSPQTIARVNLRDPILADFVEYDDDDRLSASTKFNSMPSYSLAESAPSTLAAYDTLQTERALRSMSLVDPDDVAGIFAAPAAKTASLLGKHTSLDQLSEHMSNDLLVDAMLMPTFQKTVKPRNARVESQTASILVPVDTYNLTKDVYDRVKSSNPSPAITNLRARQAKLFDNHQLLINRDAITDDVSLQFVKSSSRFLDRAQRFIYKMVINDGVLLSRDDLNFGNPTDGIAFRFAAFQFGFAHDQITQHLDVHGLTSTLVN